ncbi:MAG TPA: HupE/UreJ family protein, partial [Geminicoccaceae bacterium]
VRSGWTAIEAYAHPRVGIEGCELRAVEAAPGAAGLHRLEARADGVYAVLRWRGDCSAATSAGEPSIAYALFADVDATHRGLARIRTAGGATALRVLDPRRDGPAQPAGASARAAASAAPAADGPTTATGFLREGVHHIVTGYDHVLFLLVLLLPAVLRRDAAGGWRPVGRVGEAVWPIVGVVTAFTIAHSITLALAALGHVRLPGWFVEPAIAVTIVLAGIDNIRPIFPVRRPAVAFVFGLIHGFGFAGVLAELALPAADFALALLLFNVGLELGQLAIVALAMAVLFALRDWPKYTTVVVRGGSLAAMAVAAIWLVERISGLSILPT